MVTTPGRLEWWANSSTLLGSTEVSVAVAATDAGWTATARLLSDDADEREGFAFLCALDPVFTLLFEDGSTVTVVVHDDPGNGEITLSEFDDARLP